MLLRFFDRGGKEAGYPPPTAYWKAAITNCIGPACGFEALKYISYPAQVLCAACAVLCPLGLSPLAAAARSGSHASLGMHRLFCWLLCKPAALHQLPVGREAGRGSGVPKLFSRSWAGRVGSREL